MSVAVSSHRFYLYFKMISFSDVDDSDIEVAVMGAMAAHLKELWEVYEEDQKTRKRKIKRGKRSCWVQPYLQHRLECGN